MGRLRRMLLALVVCMVISTVLLLHYLGQSELPPSTTSSMLDFEETNEDTLPNVRLGYCHFPENIKLGSEGVPPSLRYKLKSVTTLIRHGNRLPMESTPPLGPLKHPNVSCELDIKDSYMPKQLADFIVKTNIKPTWTYETLRPQSPVCHSAGLTQLGVEQHLKTGGLLHQAYKKQLALTQLNVSVVSTTRSRTIQSAVAFVYGLLRGEVYYSSLAVDLAYTQEFCRHTKASQCSCTAAEIHRQRGEKRLREMRKTDRFFIEFDSSIHKSMGSRYSVKSYYPWKAALDMMVSRTCRKKALPCNKRYCFRVSQVNLIWQSMSHYFQHMSTDQDMLIAAKLEMYRFLKEIVLRLSDHSTRPSQLIPDKFTVYSGHDNTIIPLLIALELPVKQWPPFASRLIFELYEPPADVVRKEHVFKLVYNGKDVTRQLKFCVSSLGYLYHGCALKDLVNYVHNIVPNLGANSYAEACGSPRNVL